MIINTALQTARTLAPVEPVGTSVDVNGDGQITSNDTLRVINGLASSDGTTPSGHAGEGEGGLLELHIDATRNGQSLLDGDREFTTFVGEKFDLEVLYSDLRPEGGRIGAFTVYSDIIASNNDAFVPVLSETQIITLSKEWDDVTGGSIRLGMDNRGTTVDFSADDFRFQGVVLLKNALENEFGFGQGNITVTQEFREPGSDFGFQVRFLGDDEEFADVPRLFFDTSNLQGASVTPSTVEIPVFIDTIPPDVNWPAPLFAFGFRFHDGFSSTDLIRSGSIPIA